MTKVPNPLRAWRGQRSLAEVAGAIGVSDATLCRIENGKQFVTGPLLVRLMRATGLSADEVTQPWRDAHANKEAAA